MLSKRLRKSQPPRPCYRLPSTADKLKRDCSHCHMDSPARTRSHRLWRVVTRRQSTTMLLQLLLLPFHKAMQSESMGSTSYTLNTSCTMLLNASTPHEHSWTVFYSDISTSSSTLVAGVPHKSYSFILWTTYITLPLATTYEHFYKMPTT